MAEMILRGKLPGSIVEDVVDATPIITDYTQNIRVVNTASKSLEVIQT